MKILFSIYSVKGTPGGHFFSLEHLVHALSGKVEIAIVYVGYKMPKVIQELPFDVFQITPHVTKGKEIRELLRDIKPDVIHCFDSSSYILLTYYTMFRYYKFLLTKAGGPSPRYGYPYCKDYILYSMENLKAFKSNMKYANSNLYLIPNRVFKGLLNNTVRTKTDKFTFFQIIRINKNKHNSISKTLNLTKIFKEMNLPVRLVLAGTVTTKEEYDYIKKYIGDNKLDNIVELITDERVNRGSDLLTMGDCIIGTGRSVMEATCLGKVVLVPNAESDYPILMDSDSFVELFEYNFSGRSRIARKETDMEKIKRVINDEEFRLKVLSYANEKSKQYFQITDDIVNKYVCIYKSISTMNSFKLILMNIHLYVNYLFKEIKK